MTQDRRPFIVFYSWQSDLPSASNRTLIEDALQRATKRIRNDGSIAVDPVIDRDTAGIAGAPDIAGTIFDKIDRADAFVADVSIITVPDATRPSPNPNVLLELGYSIKTLGWNRVILVVNQHFGGPDLLPFDLRGRRALVYRSAPEDSDRATARKALEAQLESALRSVIEHSGRAVGTVISQRSLFQEALSAVRDQRGNRAAAVRRFAQDAIDRLIAGAPDLAQSEVDPQDLLASLNAARSQVAEFTEVAVLVAEFDDALSAAELYQSLERIAKHYDLQPGFSGTHWPYQFEYFMLVGYELLLVLTAALLRERRLGLLGQILRQRLRVLSARNNETDAPFHYLSPRTGYILSQLKAPNGASYLSPIGEYFYKRYAERTSNDSSISLEEVEAADLFLFLRASLPPNGAGEWAEWMPYVAVLSQVPPRFLTEAKRTDYARSLASALAQASPEALKAAIVADGRRLLVNAFSRGYRLGLSLMNYKVEEMATEL